MSEPVTTESATTAKSGVDVAAFASRRTLVLRRFLRNKPAVVSLALLVLLFIGCYALPPLLPYSYTDLDYYALQQPPTTDHWFGTNALGQDLLAQTLRGMQKSMLIGVCVAFISTIIAATVGTIAGYFGGWRDRTLMWLVDLLLVVPSFILIAIVMQRTKGDIVLADRAAVGVQLDDQLPHRARHDDEPAGTRIRRRRTVYGREQLADHRPPHRAECRVDPDHRHRAERRHRDPCRNRVELPGFRHPAARRFAGTLIADGTKSATTFPWVFLFPAGVLVLIVLCANLIGDGLRDALDPERAPAAEARK